MPAAHIRVDLCSAQPERRAPAKPGKWEGSLISYLIAASPNSHRIWRSAACERRILSSIVGVETQRDPRWVAWNYRIKETKMMQHSQQRSPQQQAQSTVCNRSEWYVPHVRSFGLLAWLHSKHGDGTVDWQFLFCDSIKQKKVSSALEMCNGFWASD